MKSVPLVTGKTASLLGKSYLQSVNKKAAGCWCFDSVHVQLNCQGGCLHESFANC